MMELWRGKPKKSLRKAVDCLQVSLHRSAEELKRRTVALGNRCSGIRLHTREG